MIGADVDANGSVSPHDALLVINELLAHNNHTLSPPGPTGPSPPYYDVFVDNTISPIDALSVINGLLARDGIQASGLPNERLTLQGTFDPTAATTITFTDESNRATTVPALKVTATTIEAVVPPYFDPVTLQFRGGVSSVTVNQVAHPSAVIYSRFYTEDLPPSSTSGGELTSAFLHELQGLMNLTQEDYKTIGIAGSIASDTLDLAFYLGVEQTGLQELIAGVDSLIDETAASVNLFVDVNDPNQVQFALTRDWLAATDREIEGWLQKAKSQSAEVTVDELREYFSSLVLDVRSARANNDSAALARTRRQFEEILALGDGTVSSGTSLKDAVVGSSIASIAPAAAAELVLGFSAIALAAVVDLEMIAQEGHGTAVADYRNTVAYLGSSGIYRVIDLNTDTTNPLFGSTQAGNGVVDAALHVQFMVAEVHDQQQNYGTLGQAIDNHFATISHNISPRSPGVFALPVDLNASLQTTEAGGTPGSTFNWRPSRRPRS